MLEACNRLTVIEVLSCPACGNLEAGPRELCPNCGHSLEALQVPGIGTLASWTVIRRPPSQFRGDAPYCVAVVDLDAAVRLTVRLQDDPAVLRIGARVALVERQDGIAMFRQLPADT